MAAKRFRINGLTADLPATYWYLWVGTLVNRLGGFVVPFLTLYLTSQRGIPVEAAGLVVSLFGAGTFAAQLAGGELTDRLGRRPVLLLSLLGTPPFMLALGFATNLYLIAALTAVVGFLTDLCRPAVQAAVIDVVPAESRTQAFGYLYWSINLGAALALVIAGLMARVSYTLLFVGDAATTLLYGLIVLWRVRETQPAEAVHDAQVPLAKRVRELGREPILLVITGLTLIFAVVYSQGMVTLPLDMERHGLGPSDYGLAAAINPVLIVFVTIQLSRLAAKWSHFGAMAAAAALLGIGFGMNAWAANLPAYMLAIAVWTIGEIIAAALAPTIIAELSPVSLRGLYQGVFGSAWGLAFFLGPLAGSWAFARYSPDFLWIGCAALGGIAAAGYLGLSGAARRRLAQGRDEIAAA